MPKITFHKLAAFVVFAIAAAWVLTGEMASVGSARQEDAAKTPEAAEAPAPVRTIGVIDAPREMHARAIRIAGHTEADKRAVLGTRAAGVITTLPVKEGQRVKEGDLILSLDNADKIAAVDMAKQVVSQREAEMEAAERLSKTGNMAKLTLDSARSALSTARSQLEAARAEENKTEVHAPFDGLIDRVPVEKGSSVQVGAEVATILALDPVIAAGEVSERDLDHVRLGDEADIRLIDGRQVKGTIRYISREAATATRTFRVEVAISNPDFKIPAGMTAEVTLRAEPVSTTILPRSVVTLSAKGDLGIRAVGPDGIVSFYPIDIVDDMPHALALGGIPKDARVIVAGQDLVKEGEKVNAVQADEATIKKLTAEVVGTE
ncbi:MAG: efflux RND transporter periplasmic adaptor subunit [Rhizobiaceae bacterium]